MRRRPDARQRHEAGGQPQGRRAADGPRGHQGQHQRRPTSTRSQSVRLARFEGEAFKLVGEILSNEARANNGDTTSRRRMPRPPAYRAAEALNRREKDTGDRQVRAHQAAAGLRAGRGGDRAQDPRRPPQAGRSGRHPIRARQAVRRQPLDRARGHPPARAVGPRLARAEPPPVGGRAALPPPRHPHDARAHPAAGDVPRAVASASRALEPRRRRSGHGQPDGRGPGRARCQRRQDAQGRRPIRPPSAELDAEFHS